MKKLIVALVVIIVLVVVVVLWGVLVGFPGGPTPHG